MFFKSTALLAMLALSCAAHAENAPESSTQGAVFSESGEGYMVRQMLSIDATLGLKTEQQKFQERLEASRAKLPSSSANAFGGKASMTPPVDQAPLAPQAAPVQPDILLNSSNDVAEPTPAAPVLVGVFGIGHSLSADVEFDNKRVRFQSGRKSAIGADSRFPLKLVSINPPCITLKSDQGNDTLCLPPVASVGGVAK